MMHSESIYAQLSNHQPRSARASSNANSAPRDARALHEVEQAAADAAPFAALLVVLRAGQSLPFESPVRPAAAQMFDAPPDSAEAATGHAAPDDAAQATVDPRGIESRRMQASADPSREFDKPQVSQSPHRERPLELRGKETNAGDAARNIPSEPLHRPAKPAHAQNHEPARGQSRQEDTPAQNDRSPSRPVAVSPPSSVTNAAPAARTPLASAATNSGELAQQIGRALTQTRVAETSPTLAASPQAARSPAGAEARSRPAEARSHAAPREPAPDQPDQSKATEFDQLVKSIRMRVGMHRSTARMHLDPPELGRLRIDVRMTGEALRIDVRAQTPEAQRLIHSRAGDLRTALAQAGIRVDRFDVSLQSPVPALVEQRATEPPPPRAGDRRSRARQAAGADNDQPSATASRGAAVPGAKPGSATSVHPISTRR